MKVIPLLLLTAPTLLFSAANPICSSVEKAYSKGVRAAESGKYRRSIKHLERASGAVESSCRLSDSIYYHLGNSYFAKKKYSDARYAFRYVVDSLSRSPYFGESAYMMARCTYYYAPNTDRDTRMLRRAQKEFNTVLNTYPIDPWKEDITSYIHSIEQKLVEKEYNNARFYEKQGYWDSAILYYGSILDDFPHYEKRSDVQKKMIGAYIEAHRFHEAESAILGLDSDEFNSAEIEALEMRLQKKRVNSL